MGILEKIKNYAYFKLDKHQNYYACKLIGEAHTNTNEATSIVYKQYGYHSFFEKPINELFEDKELLYKFHPEDVSKITIIAFGEIFFKKNLDEAKKIFNQVKKDILNTE